MYDDIKLRLKQDKYNLQWEFKDENNLVYTKLVFAIKGEDPDTLICKVYKNRKIKNSKIKDIEMSFKNFKKYTALEMLEKKVNNSTIEGQVNKINVAEYLGEFFKDAIFQIWHDLDLPLGFFEKQIMRDKYYGKI